jgi:hypothetical protein
MLLTTLPESAIYTKYGADAFPEDADKAWCDGHKFAKCWVTGKWELITPENPLIETIEYCVADRSLHRTINTIGNAKRLAERWNNDPDTHPNQIITHLVDINGNVHQISDRQFTLF